MAPKTMNLQRERENEFFLPCEEKMHFLILTPKNQLISKVFQKVVKIEPKNLWTNRGHFSNLKGISDKKTFFSFHFGHPVKKGRVEGPCALEGPRQIKFRGSL